MNTHKPTKHAGAQREPFYRRDDLIVCGASSNASDTAKQHSQHPDHRAKEQISAMQPEHQGRESDGHRTMG